MYLIATLLGEISRTQLCSQKKAERRVSRMRRLKKRVTTFKQKCRLQSKQSSESRDNFISEEVIDYRTSICTKQESYYQLNWKDISWSEQNIWELFKSESQTNIGVVLWQMHDSWSRKAKMLTFRDPKNYISGSFCWGREVHF